jgi:ubiquinol-cytochrome c reductase iron-sulfur subunit
VEVAKGSGVSAGPQRDGRTPDDRGRGGLPIPSWPATVGLLVTVAGAIGFAVSFVRDLSAAWLGGCLAAALLGLGLTLAYWGRDLAGDEVISGPYPVPHEDAPGRGAFGDQLDGTVDVVTRRGALARLLVVGVGVFALSQIVLLGALGPRPKNSLRTTSWRAGSRLVTFDGRPVTRDTLAAGTFLVAFPEGHTGAADSQVMLLRIAADPSFKTLPGRETWSPEGYVAYSRVCTHAGCPVAQYEDQAQVLVCPCHQSTFDLLNGAQPVAGPAGRPLPQLPLAVDAQGRLTAQSDFTVPIGPGFWNEG